MTDTISNITAELMSSPMQHHLKGLSWTGSGYGKKIPTQYKALHNGRWYRVYCCIFSNSGTCYIISKGEIIIIDNVYGA